MQPKLRLSMDSEVANRLFQGQENPAIAIARGRLRPKIDDPSAALRFFPAAKPLFSRYRGLVARSTPTWPLTSERSAGRPRGH